MMTATPISRRTTGSLTRVTLCVSLACLCGWAGAQAQPTCSFLDPAYTFIGNSPRALAAGDVDGDGDVDFVVAQSTGATQDPLRVWRNNGDGTFSSGASTTGGNGPSDIALVDIDGDGDLDLLSVNRFSSDLVRNRNLGGGTFSGPTSFAGAGTAQGLAVADFDNDGDVDAAVTVEFNNVVRIFRNNGSGGFTAGATFAVGADPEGITATDLDGDGDVDLAVANSDADTVSVLLNNGNGSFAPQVVYPVGPGPFPITHGDLDGDGDLDLIAGNWGTTSPLGEELSILLNNGNGTFAPEARLRVHARPIALAAVDLNGDGILDLVSGDQFDEGVSYALGVGDGTFHPPVFVDLFDRPVDVAVADFDVDGAPDILVLNNLFEYAALLINDCGTPPPAPALEKLWQTSVDNSGGDESANFVAVDSGGNIVLAGFSETGFDRDYWAAKLAPDGTLLWQTSIDGGTQSFDDLADMAVTPDGDVLLTGKVDAPGGATWGTARLDGATGTIEWLVTQPGGSFVGARGVQSDSAGNALVIGRAGSATLVKYDSTGSVVWQRSLPGASFAALAVGGNDDIWVAGSMSVAVGFELLVARYDAAGNLLFTTQIDASNSGFNETSARAIVVDDAGDAYVTGSGHNNGTFDDIVTARIDPAGNVVWSRVFADTSDTDGMAVAIDTSGNVFASGRLGTCCEQLVIYDAAGTQLGAVFNALDLNEDNPRDHLVVLPDGTAIIGGQLGSDFVLVAFDALGNELWYQRLDGGNASDLFGAVALAASHELAAAGRHTPTGSTNRDALAMRLRLAGTGTPGDIDGDGDVDLIDLSLLLNAFGTCSGDAGFDPNADLDGSGCVDLVDLSTLLNNFGT